MSCSSSGRLLILAANRYQSVCVDARDASLKSLRAFSVCLLLGHSIVGYLASGVRILPPSHSQFPPSHSHLNFRMFRARRAEVNSRGPPLRRPPVAAY